VVGLFRRSRFRELWVGRFAFNRRPIITCKAPHPHPITPIATVETARWGLRQRGCGEDSR
jgi:hypothetical protein